MSDDTKKVSGWADFLSGQYFHNYETGWNHNRLFFWLMAAPFIGGAIGIGITVYGHYHGW